MKTASHLFLILALCVNAVLLMANGVMLARNLGNLRQAHANLEQSRDLIDRAKRLNEPPVPYHPGMTLLPGQSTTILIPLPPGFFQEEPAAPAPSPKDHDL